MLRSYFLFSIVALVILTQVGLGQLQLRDNFNRSATGDLSTSPTPYKWVKLANQPNSSASLQINSDSTISPINSAGTGNFGGVAWDSVLTDTTQVGLVVKRKAGNGSNSTFFIYIRMSNKDLSTGRGYRVQYTDYPSGTDQISLARMSSGTNATTLRSMNREIAVGDTLMVRVEANKTMKVLVCGINGVRDSISVVDNTFNPSTWYCWLRGCVFTTSVKMDEFSLGKIPQPESNPNFSVTPTSLAFDNVVVLSTKTDSLRVTNIGGGTLTIGSVVSDNAQFTVSPTSAGLGASASQEFYVTYAPAGAGSTSGNIIFTHNAAGSPTNVAASGNGVTPQPSIRVSPTSLILDQVPAAGRTSRWVEYVPPPDSIRKANLSRQTKAQYSLGLIIPDSVVQYWRTHGPQLKYNPVTFPAALDWSSYDSPVKDQSSCGSCWAFAAVGLVENLGAQPDLSEQVVISCANSGTCGGGWYFNALAYAQSTGIPEEACYPYSATDGNCSTKCAVPQILEKITQYSPQWGLWGDPATVDNIRAALQTGPIIVAFQVYSDFYSYTGGIYNHTSGTYQGLHAVLVVGYNDSQQCFKVKNSWGPWWGEGGYFRIAYDAVTNDVHFGAYAATASGAYSVSHQNTFTIQNVGNAPLIVSSVSRDKSWLSTDTDAALPLTLAAGDSERVTLSVSDWSRVTPPQEGATVAVGSNDPANPTVGVSVTAIPRPGFQVTPSFIDFGSVKAGRSKLDSLTVKNTGSVPLVISSTSVDNYSPFQVIPTSGTVAAGDSMKFYVLFVTPPAAELTHKDPSWYAYMQGNVTFIHNAAGSPSSVGLAGFAYLLLYEAPSSIDFGEVAEGNVKVDTIEVFDGARSWINIDSVVSDNASFTVTPRSGFVSPASSDTFLLTFHPFTPGYQTGNIVFWYDNLGSPDTVHVSGRGTTSISLRPTSADSVYHQGAIMDVGIEVGNPNRVTDLYALSCKLRWTNPGQCMYVDGSCDTGSFFGAGVVSFFRKTDDSTLDMSVSRTSPPGVSGRGITMHGQFMPLSTSSLSFTVKFSLFDIAAIDSRGHSVLLPDTTLSVTVIPGICVWPGDCDNNGIVDARDLLRIGLYYGQSAISGPSNPGIQWQCYLRGAWISDSSRPNRIFADANGDSIINAADVIPIGFNYGLTRGPEPPAEEATLAQVKSSTSNASLTINGPNTGFVGGSKFTVKVDVSTTKGVYGISFKIRYRVLGKTYGEREGGGYFLGVLGVDGTGGVLADGLQFSEIMDSIGTVDIASTRTGGRGFVGSGTLVTLDLGLSAHVDAADVVTLEIFDAFANDESGNPVTVGGGRLTGVPVAHTTPDDYELEQNYPNPFNPTTRIHYALPVKSQVVVSVFNVLGIKLATLISEAQESGYHVADWNAATVASGIYFYRLDATSMASPNRTFSQVRRMVLLK